MNKELRVIQVTMSSNKYAKLYRDIETAYNEHFKGWEYDYTLLNNDKPLTFDDAKKYIKSDLFLLVKSNSEDVTITLDSKRVY